MKNIALMIIVTVMLTSCGYLNRNSAMITGVTKVCVDGVQYLQFPSGVTVQYDKQGRMVTCQ